MKKKEHSKYYYEYDRNMSSTYPIDDKRVPEYYKGKEGYQARKVCDNFDLTYHLATATTYILRAYKKHDTPVDCIKKAIAHLEFELEKINEK
jgi:ribosome-associated translation inhibitor RaiA